MRLSRTAGRLFASSLKRWNSEEKSVAVKHWQARARGMQGRIAAFVMVWAAAIAPANGRAMTAAGKGAQGSCRVASGEKLLAKAGGAEALCAAVERAVAKAAPKAHYKAEVTVLPRSRMSTTLIVNG